MRVEPLYTFVHQVPKVPMILAIAALTAMSQTSSFPPVAPVPAPRQIAWQDMETNVFVHFGPNTFNDVEWGGGNEDPNSFNPTDLDCDQWCRAFKAAGFKGVIITAKHHDGFCLWPSKLSTHTVAQSKWKDGKGDVLKELSSACRRNGLKFGVYLSPWDRNHPSYGTPEYNRIFASMLEEVLTKYGPIFEVWFDGANGEGPNGKKQVYDWPLFHETVRRLQPNAVMFSDAGPDVRWVGNEEGQASKTSWSMIPSGRYHPGTPLYSELGEGSPNGDEWVTPECDVSIRPGWFYHPEEETKVKTPAQLFSLYENSVGRNSLLLLNVPPDRRGKVTDAEEASLVAFHKMVTDTYGTNLAKGAKFEESAPRGHGFEASNVLRGKGHFWAPSDAANVPSFTARLAHPVEFDRVVLGEPIALGQRVSGFRVEAQGADGTWTVIGEGTTVGRKRILPVPLTAASAVRITVTGSRACPAINLFSLNRAP